MIYQVFAIYDMKADAHMKPFFLQNEAMAKRSFIGAAKDKESPMGMFPEDFYLACLGDWEDESGEFRPDGAGVVMSGAALKKELDQ